MSSPPPRPDDEFTLLALGRMWQLWHAVATLWDYMPERQVAEIRDQQPDLAAFCDDILARIEARERRRNN
jgi:hypothetical protein